MRVSTLQTFNTSVTQMQKGQTNLVKLQEQISTGKRLLRPSDDPVAAAQILKLERELARVSKFEENMDVTERRLSLQETVLNNINTATDRARELTIQANNASLVDADRLALASELRQIQDEILGMMNSRDSQGEYLFGGSKGFVEPFVRNPGGGFSYQGDDGQRKIQVGAGLQIASGDSGRSVFEVIADDIAVSVMGDPTDTANLAVSVVDPTDGSFRAFANTHGDLTINISNVNAGVDYDYSIVNSAGVTVGSGVGQLVGTPISIGGLNIDYSGAADPTSFTLRANEGKHSILQTLEEVATALETPITDATVRTAFEAAMSKGLVEYGVAADANILTRTQVGARLVSVESSRQANADFKLFTQSALSSLRDLDYSEAISQFSLQEVALNAAQQTFSRVSGLSLFNFL